MSMSKLFVIILDTFNDTRAATATKQSVVFGVNSAVGILTGALVHKIGPRKAGLLGSMLILIGLTSSFLATSVVYLVFSVGLCFALGLSLNSISFISVIGMYFNGKSSVMALSVLSTSAGVGGMVYPYLIDALNEKYGLRGTLLVIGGLTSHGLACSFLCGQITAKLESANDRSEAQPYCLKTVCTVCTNSVENDTNVANAVETFGYNKTTNQLKVIDKDATQIQKSFVKPLKQNSSGKGLTTSESQKV